MDTKGQAKGGVGLIAIVAIVAILFFMRGGTGGTPATPAAAATSPTEITVKETGQTNSVTIGLVNPFTSENLGAGLIEHSRVYIKRADGGYAFDRYVASGGSASYKGATQLRVYGAENSTQYYTNRKDIDVEDAESQNVFINVYRNDSVPTLVMFNDRDQVNTAQPIGANDIKTVKIRVTAGSRVALGNPTIKCTESGTSKTQNAICIKDNAMCFRYNTSVWDSVKPTDATYGSFPGSTTVKDADLVATGFTTSCYKFPVLVGTQPNEFGLPKEFDMSTEIDSDSVNDPTTAFDNQINASVWDVDYDLDANTEQEIASIQDESDNNLGAASFDSILVLAS